MIYTINRNNVVFDQEVLVPLWAAFRSPVHFVVFRGVKVVSQLQKYFSGAVMNSGTTKYEYNQSQLGQMVAVSLVSLSSCQNRCF